jgi:N-acetylglucosaminyldiphosphoundecaprenol N-acetyl-beta-D-mannosaminyltransferase
MVERIATNVRDSFPGISLVGTYHINYKKTFEKKLITALQKASPSLILVGNKAPKQEKWIYRRRNKFNSGVFIGVGDFINIIGGKGASPSEKSVQSSFFSFIKTFKNPLKIYRLFFYFLYIPYLLFYKIFK